MNIRENITADWARKTAHGEMGSRVREQVDKALGMIEAAALENKTTCDLIFTLDDLAQDELRRRGFKVKEVNMNSSDPREHDYLTVSW